MQANPGLSGPKIEPKTGGMPFVTCKPASEPAPHAPLLCEENPVARGSVPRAA